MAQGQGAAEPGLSLAGLDLVPLCVTFLLCFWEVQYGIVAGVLVSGILLLYSIARPPIKVGFTPPLGCSRASRARQGAGSWEGTPREHRVLGCGVILSHPHPLPCPQPAVGAAQGPLSKITRKGVSQELRAGEGGIAVPVPADTGVSAGGEFP